MKEIKLTQGRVALVDDDLYEELNSVKWYAIKSGNTFYAVRKSPTIKGNRHIIRMHREILGGFSKNLKTDHRDGNGLNNQRNNLRHVTNRQNCQNKQNIKKPKTSKYPGVWWYEVRKRWISQIVIDGKFKMIGRFKCEKDAFEAYKYAVEKIGETVIASDNYVC